MTQQQLQLEDGRTHSQEEHRGAADQGSREPGLLPAQDAVSGQDHLAPALQLLLQLGRFLGLDANTQSRVRIRTQFSLRWNESQSNGSFQGEGGVAAVTALSDKQDTDKRIDNRHDGAFMRLTSFPL